MKYYSVLLSTLLLPFSISNAAELTAIEKLGKSFFFDANLSNPAGQSCASCHSPDTGFADPRQHLPVSEGAVKNRFTLRSAPTVAYAGYSPDFHYDEKEEMFMGGYFTDGRATRMQDQAAGPLLGLVEMNNLSKESIVEKVNKGEFRQLMRGVFGEKIFANKDNAYEKITDALVAYQRSSEVNPFNSKYDHFLAGKAKLTAQEKRGLDIFEKEDKGNCAACHPNTAPDKELILFTDFSYDNVGLPKNNKSPFYTQDKAFNPLGKKHIDYGLFETTKKEEDKGKFKVPTLRNIALTAPYMHNGIFETLKDVVEFYNTRDVEKWGEAEVKENVNNDELGDLKLSESEVDDLVSYLKTLSDI